MTASERKEWDARQLAARRIVEAVTLFRNAPGVPAPLRPIVGDFCALLVQLADCSHPRWNEQLAQMQRTLDDLTGITGQAGAVPDLQRRLAEVEKILGGMSK
jgi:hypothetical protein